MIEIKTLDSLDADALKRVISGYTSHEKYRVVKVENDERVSITFELVSLTTPYVKAYDHLDEITLDHYSTVVKEGWSYGAFDGDKLVGIALTEHQRWNNTLWV